MKQKYRLIPRMCISKILLLGMMSVLTACGGQSAAEKAAAEQQAKAKKVVKQVQPADPLAGMSSAITGSKGTVPVEVRFELLDRPEPNKPVNVRLAFVPSTDLDALHAVVKPSTGLQVAEDTQVKFDAPKSGEIKEYKYVAIPTAAGIFLCNIDVTVTRDTGDTQFTFTLPIPVPEATTGKTASSGVNNAVPATK